MFSRTGYPVAAYQRLSSSYRPACCSGRTVWTRQPVTDSTMHIPAQSQSRRPDLDELTENLVAVSGNTESGHLHDNIFVLVGFETAAPRESAVEQPQRMRVPEFVQQVRWPAVVLLAGAGSGRTAHDLRKRRPGAVRCVRPCPAGNGDLRVAVSNTCRSQPAASGLVASTTGNGAGGRTLRSLRSR